AGDPRLRVRRPRRGRATGTGGGVLGGLRDDRAAGLLHLHRSGQQHGHRGDTAGPRALDRLRAAAGRPLPRGARRRAPARAGDAAEVGFFARLARIVQRRPLVTALLTGAALVGAGAPLVSTTMHLDDVSSFPKSLEAVTVANDLAGRFNVATSPAVVVVARTD